MTDDVNGRAKIDAAPSAYQYPLLLKQILATGVARSSRQEIVHRDLVRYDYQTLDERVARLANGLSGAGVGLGDTVGVLDWDSHRYLECYFAVPGIGAVLHTVNIRLSAEQILYTINHAADDVLLVHADFLPVLEEIWDRIECVRLVVILRDDEVSCRSVVPVAFEYEAMLAAASPVFDFPDLDENTRATTFYTTGTTGAPKGVYFSHRQLVLHTLAAATALGTAPQRSGLHRGDVYMPITPMFHVHAWGMPFVATMLGLKQVYPGKYSPSELLRLRKVEGVTFSHCVPTLLHMLLSSPEAEATDLSGWKCIIGGSAFPRGTAQAALDRGMEVFAGYGMSETCPILSIAEFASDKVDADVGLGLDVRTGAGNPIPLVDIRIVDRATAGTFEGRTAPGEIVVRTPWLTQGYIGDPRSSEELWQGGYLHTGDVGVLGPDGRLRITDRIKDVIKTGGEWISSLEIENLLSQHAGVAEVAVIGVPDDRWGERPVAIVASVPEGGVILTEEALKAYLLTYCDRGIISKWAVPDRIIFVESIAKTSVGKLDKKLLRRCYGGD